MDAAVGMDEDALGSDTSFSDEFVTASFKCSVRD